MKYILVPLDFLHVFDVKSVRVMSTVNTSHHHNVYSTYYIIEEKQTYTFLHQHTHTHSIKSCFWGAVKCLHFALNASANNLCEKTTASKSCTNFKPTTDMLLSSSHQQILASQKKKKKKKCKEKKQDLKLLKSTAL